MSLQQLWRNVNLGLRVQNQVGLPSCRITANRSFLHLSKYGGEPRKFLKTRNPSSTFISLLTEVSDFKSPAVYVLPLVLHLRNDKLALP